MKWVRTPQGDKAHAVLDGTGETLCGLPLTNAAIAVNPGFDDTRCGNCEKEWRRRGRLNKPKPKRSNPKTNYRPRFTLKDWEDV